MGGFLSRIFGANRKKDDAVIEGSAEELLQEVLDGLITRSGLDLHFEMRSEVGGEQTDIYVDLNGADAPMLTDKQGSLLDAFQLFCKRVLQHRMPDVRADIHFDVEGFRDETAKALIELCEDLRGRCLESGRSQYTRPLVPRDRKVIHQFLAEDERVKSRSIGEGLFKKVKIYVAREQDAESAEID